MIVAAAAAGLSVAAVVLAGGADSTSEPGLTVAAGASLVAGFRVGFDATFAAGFDATFAAGFDATFAVGFDATFAVGFDATFAVGFDATAAAGFDAATDTVDGEIDARRGSALPAASPSSEGCRAVISAAAARTHVMPTTIMRQLYAFGGGGIGGSGTFAAPAVFAGAALDRALVPLKRSDSFRSEIF